MGHEDFLEAVREMSPVQEEGCIRQWMGFAHENAEMGMFIDFREEGDKDQEEERWLDILHAGFCAVREGFSQEVLDALIGLGLESCILYPGEMVQAAVCLEHGINARQLFVLMDACILEAEDPFRILSREEAEREVADAGIIPKSVPEGHGEGAGQAGTGTAAPGEGAERKGGGMAGWKTQEEVDAIRRRYPIGSRIELDYMNEQGMPPGLKGIVKSVDDAGQLHMIWENGRSLALVPGTDRFHRLPEPQAEKEAGKEALPEETEEMER
ncbi:DUF4314 domain-containing protein [uncultured Acetatifactor sp.]|jgi:hypothetical protein|uniref:DUF4314 domain-containing protein n=1 Tax=uncultured Acetatifactor sp. TaxID=1671927 RepID=UPI002ED53352